jgi:hypothetical protein
MEVEIIYRKRFVQINIQNHSLAARELSKKIESFFLRLWLRASSIWGGGL